MYNKLDKEYYFSVDHSPLCKKLSNIKYLFGKSKCKISWPLFIYFILHEEEEFRLNSINYDNSLKIKTELLKYNEGKENNNKHIND